MLVVVLTCMPIQRNTTIIIAAQHNHADCVELAIQHGANWKERSKAHVGTLVHDGLIVLTMHAQTEHDSPKCVGLGKVPQE